MNDVLIVSPSGKLYGSERVLLDFIYNTSLAFDLAVPAEGDLHNLLSREKRQIKTIVFNSARLHLFYGRVFFFLFTGRYKKLYLNEGAHTRYILWLARLFKKARFTIHVRIIEDAAAGRWRLEKTKLPANLKVITISDYISQAMLFETDVIPDPFIFSDATAMRKKDGRTLNVGIVGRISLSKGIELLPFVINEIKSRGLNEKIIVHLYGETGNEVGDSIKAVLNSNKNIMLHGYVKDSESIYINLDAVMHLSETEPLGRVFFEATNYELPFIGINAGGIGETARKYEYIELMVEPGDKKTIAVQLVDKLLLISDDPIRYYEAAVNLKACMQKSMSVENYCRSLDAVITGRI